MFAKDRWPISISAQISSRAITSGPGVQTFTGPNGVPPRSFRQSTFFADALPSAALSKRADTFVPTLSREGAVDRFILECFGHGRSLADVTDSVLANFPGRFQKRQAALSHVAHLSAKYSD